MTGLAHQLRWLIGIRLLVVTSVALPYALLRLTHAKSAPGPGVPPIPGAPASEPAFDLGFLFGLALLTYLACGVYWLLLRNLEGRHVLQGYVQFLGDLLLITVLIAQFEGPSNPFSLLYLIIIGAASVLLRRQAGFTIATVAYLLYAGVTLSPYFLGGEPLPEAAGEWFILLYNLAVHLFGFYAVALLTYHLVHRVARAERELEEKREDLADLQVVHRDVIQSINSGLITTDLEGTITSANRAGVEILGAPARQLLGRPVYELSLLSRRDWEEMSRAAHRQTEQVRSESKIERDGEITHVGFSLSKLTNAENEQEGWIVIFQDFTQWRRLEQEVRLKDRMAAVGEMAAGLAHELGNPLAAISGSVQMLSKTLRERGDDTKLLDILLKESQRLDRTIKGFLRFARPRERASGRFDVAALLKENFALLENSDEITPKHDLELDVTPESASLVGDADQVSQIFWNLVRNALKAMPDGGRLRVRGRLSGPFYRLSVADTGHGMTEEERANLFHPFQSFFDSGTGIGMAIVYRIVEEHGGRVTVHSRPGGGTEIVVELPVEGVGTRPEARPGEVPASEEPTPEEMAEMSGS